MAYDVEKMGHRKKVPLVYEPFKYLTTETTSGY